MDKDPLPEKEELVEDEAEEGSDEDEEEAETMVKPKKTKSIKLKQDGDSSSKEDDVELELPDAKEAKAMVEAAEVEKLKEMEPILEEMVNAEMKKIARAMREYVVKSHFRGAFTYEVEGCDVPKKDQRIPSMVIEKIMNRLKAKGYGVSWEVKDDGTDYGDDDFGNPATFLKRGLIAYYSGNDYEDFDDEGCLPTVILNLNFSQAESTGAHE